MKPLSEVEPLVVKAKFRANVAVRPCCPNGHHAVPEDDGEGHALEDGERVWVMWSAHHSPYAGLICSACGDQFPMKDIFRPDEEVFLCLRANEVSEDGEWEESFWALHACQLDIPNRALRKLGMAA